MKAVFLDRDATINVGVPKYERVDSLDKVELLPKSIEALRLLASLDYKVIIVTNQAGIAEGRISIDEFNAINDKVLDLIKPSGIIITKIYVCPHGFDEGCECRKPKPKLIFDAAKEFDIDLKSSYMIGDRPTDVQTGLNAGTKTILVMTGHKTAAHDQANHVAADLLEAVKYITKNH
jgi:histidinol-phosphate phosphatase family protein